MGFCKVSTWGRCRAEVGAGEPQGCHHLAALGCRGKLPFPKGLATEGGRSQGGGLCPDWVISVLTLHSLGGIEFLLESLVYVLLRGLGIVVCHASQRKPTEILAAFLTLSDQWQRIENKSAGEWSLPGGLPPSSTFEKAFACFLKSQVPHGHTFRVLKMVDFEFLLLT